MVFVDPELVWQMEVWAPEFVTLLKQAETRGGGISVWQCDETENPRFRGGCGVDARKIRARRFAAEQNVCGPGA